MSARRLLPCVSLALFATVAFVPSFVASADDVEPQPATSTKDEPAVASVDLAKAKTDKKLADQADRDQRNSLANLRNIAAGVHSYHDANNALPDDVVSKAKKPLLSWRVALLPHVGQKALYQKFKLDEPWDSPHNKKLIAKMPDVFRSPRVKLKSKGHTVYQVFTGADAVFGRAQPFGLANIPDGTSNTIMAVETSTGVPWTKPGGIPFDRTKAVPAFGNVYGRKPLAALFDGSIRVIDLDVIKPETLKNAIDPADGNVLGNDW